MASLRQELIARVAKLGVEDRPLAGRDDGFSSLCYQGKPFAHFHDDHELDIHLTRKVIEQERLTHPPDSRVHPKRNKKSHWIEVRFKSRADLARVARLIKLAIEQL